MGRNILPHVGMRVMEEVVQDIVHTPLEVYQRFGKCGKMEKICGTVSPHHPALNFRIVILHGFSRLSPGICLIYTYPSFGMGIGRFRQTAQLEYTFRSYYRPTDVMENGRLNTCLELPKRKVRLNQQFQLYSDTKQILGASGVKFCQNLGHAKHLKLLPITSKATAAPRRLTTS